MSKMKKGLSKKHISRVVLTDTLPYELPLYFSNYLLFQRLSSGDGAHKLVEAVLSNHRETKACKFHISKRPQGVRELALMHPAVQRGVVNFYKQYDGFISQLCSRSKYSLRYPLRPASRFFDSRYSDGAEDEVVEIDEVGFDTQSEFASSYFAYRRYSQVYKFFDSEEFIGLEQKYSCLLRVDISKCFASIYTHSIAWAIRGKQFAKDVKSKKNIVYFESAFDTLMRDANWGETNGIIVGPEVSRIFCEIILQGVDVNVASRLEGGVEIKRYMDDYFIFASSPDAARGAETVIAEELAKFNLYLNEGKRRLEHRPLVSSLSIARLEVNDLCSELVSGLKPMLRAHVAANGADADEGATESASQAISDESADKIIRRIRSIAKQHGVEYSGLAAPSLAVIGRKLNGIYAKLEKNSSPVAPELAPKIQRHLAKIVRVSEFLYVSDVRSSTSNKIARVFLEVADICEKLKLGRSFVELQMLDVVRKAMNIWKDATLLDLVNAVVAVKIISSGGRGLERVDIENVLSRQTALSEHDVGYIRTVLALFLCANEPKLAVLKGEITSAVISSIRVPGRVDLGDASFAYLLLDLLVCPYLETAAKIDLYRLVAIQLFSAVAVSDAEAKGELTKLGKSVHFTDWAASSGDLRKLRSLLRKSELRLAYD